MRSLPRFLASVVAMIALAAVTGVAQMAHTSRPFEGPKANTGTVTHTVEGGKHVLTLSDDFKVPDTPDPHWQVVTSKGQVFLLQKLTIKGDKVNRSITLPAYIGDVAKVQIWCAWAETNLGEATFERALTTATAQ
ncbi:MAG TPA: hypothetical protein VD833_23985 [Vicinamibacterales bacterium]|nr:hypothetical protein [Vicinamibacterales bacterium]